MVETSTIYSQIYWKYSSVQRSTVDDRGPGGGSGVVVGVQMCVGMVHTTAPHSSREGNVMSAAIWWRPSQGVF